MRDGRLPSLPAVAAQRSGGCCGSTCVPTCVPTCCDIHAHKSPQKTYIDRALTTNECSPRSICRLKAVTKRLTYATVDNLHAQTPATETWTTLSNVRANRCIRRRSTKGCVGADVCCGGCLSEVDTFVMKEHGALVLAFPSGAAPHLCQVMTPIMVIMAHELSLPAPPCDNRGKASGRSERTRRASWLPNAKQPRRKAGGPVG